MITSNSGVNGPVQILNKLSGSKSRVFAAALLIPLLINPQSIPTKANLHGSSNINVDTGYLCNFKGAPHLFTHQVQFSCHE